VPALITRTLEKNNLLLKDINHFIYHQANAYILNLLRKKSKIDINKLCIDMETTGNTVSSSIPIVLANLLSSGKTRPGDKILLAGFGVGLSWGATIITIE
jgi:3-oxoacyl-[acyl-carrier-protein] synthase-3